MSLEITTSGVLSDIAAERVFEFGYDKDTEQFMVGGQSIPLGLDWEREAYDIITKNDPLKPAELVDYSIVFGGITELFSLPKMERFVFKLKPETRKRLVMQTQCVMKDVHNAVSHERSDFNTPLESGFYVSLQGVAPDLSIGIHTSIGPWAAGRHGERIWQVGAAQMITNNEEMLEDRAALLAGLGFIASEAN